MDDDALYASRLELVDFLIEALHDVPDEAFVERLLSGEFRTPEGEVNEPLDHGFAELRAFVAENEGRDPGAVHDDVEREYTRVFVGPRPPVVAHETYYRDDTDFMGEGLADVEASYGAAGWSPPEDYPEENDFVAVELAFLRHLIDRQRAGAEEAVGFERVFLEEHALRWVEPFTTELREQTDSRLYVAVAGIYEGLLAFEDELVAQLG
ncbi:TorD/DmsD family molecular chaperone [Haloplanus halophilus]|uniref:TorD/DmsD family molecular chaperone n=1 Tax=Haloplanus halophilus TaxID=2949993 RepID=UPI0020419588|nr:molecular chaperone TorD family protein [Haloplanus sp. GDY1]